MTKKRYVKNDWDFRFEQRVKYQDKQRNIILQGILSDDKANYQDNTENREVEVVTTTSLPRARVLYILQRLQGRRTTINLMRQYNIYYSNNSNV
jgi:hypothetical protein